MNLFYLLIMVLVVLYSEKKFKIGRGLRGGGDVPTGVKVGIGLVAFLFILFMAYLAWPDDDDDKKTAAAGTGAAGDTAGATAGDTTGGAGTGAATTGAATTAGAGAGTGAGAAGTGAAGTGAAETYTVSCASCPDSFKNIAGDYEIIPSPDGKYNTCLVKGKYRPIYKRKAGQNNGLGELWLYAITEKDGTHVGWMIGGHHKCEHSRVEAYVRIDTLDPANDTHAQISSAAGNWWLARNYASDYIGDPNWKHFPDLKIELKS